MSSYRRRCVLCDVPIARPFWLCPDCEEKAGVVGVPSGQWPAWLKAICSDEARFRRRSAREVVGPFGAETVWSEMNQDGYIAPPQWEPRRVTDGDLLRYAPYADESLNGEYRRANSIPERDE